MNNQADRFYQENGEIVAQLIECLDAILEKFDSGIIPGDPEKADALYMLNKYLDALLRFKKEKVQAFKKIIENNESIYDEEKSVAELWEKKECIKLLVRFGWEKLISIDDSELLDGKGEFLLKSGYLDEIATGANDPHYYTLSSKGEKIIKSKKLFSTIRENLSSAIMPQTLVSGANAWSSLYVRRVEMINEYFQKLRKNVDHIIFSLDNSKDMVFACEVNDSIDVNYVFAGIFDEKIDEHISKLKGIANSGLVDQIVILNRSEEGKKLLEGKGLSAASLSSIVYEKL